MCIDMCCVVSQHAGSRPGGRTHASRVFSSPLYLFAILTMRCAPARPGSPCLTVAHRVSPTAPRAPSPAHSAAGHNLPHTGDHYLIKCRSAASLRVTALN